MNFRISKLFFRIVQLLEKRRKSRGENRRRRRAANRVAPEFPTSSNCLLNELQQGGSGPLSSTSKGSGWEARVQGSCTNGIVNGSIQSRSSPKVGLSSLVSTLPCSHQDSGLAVMLVKPIPREAPSQLDADDFRGVQESNPRVARFSTNLFLRYNGLAIQRGKVVIRNRIRAKIGTLTLLLGAVRSFLLWYQYRRHTEYKFYLSSYVLFDIFHPFGNRMVIMYWHFICVLGFGLAFIVQLYLTHSDRFMGFCELAKLDETLEIFGKLKKVT